MERHCGDEAELIWFPRDGSNVGCQSQNLEPYH